MQGVGNTRKLKYFLKGMNSMRFIKKKLVPKHKTVTYARFVADIRPQKDEPRRTRLNAGGKILEYDGIMSTEMSGL